MIVTDILLEPVAIRDEIARQTSAEQMLKTVWHGKSNFTDPNP
jgi:hypothetical protein